MLLAPNRRGRMLLAPKSVPLYSFVQKVQILTPKGDRMGRMLLPIHLQVAQSKVMIHRCWTPNAPRVIRITSLPVLRMQVFLDR